MNKARPKYVVWNGRAGRKKLCFQRKGCKSITMRCQDLGSPEFWLEYTRLLRGAPLPVSGPTFAHLLTSYKASERFTRLAPRTRKDYDKCLAYLHDKIGTKDPKRLRRQHVVQMRDGIPAPRFANYVVSVLKVVLEHAIDMGIRDDNPAKGVQARRYEGRQREAWPADLIDAFRATATGREALLFEILLGTGQRIGDVLRMRWSDYADGAVRVVQGKTKARLEVPATARLRAALEAQERRSVFILTNERGTGPWSYRGAAQAMLKVRRAIGAEDYDLHALRYSAAAELAAVGCTDEQIAAVTGHQSVAMVRRYAGAARQKARAKEAQERRE